MRNSNATWALRNANGYLVAISKSTNICTWGSKTQAWKVAYPSIAYQILEYLWKQCKTTASIVNLNTGQVFASSCSIKRWEDMPYELAWINPKTNEHDCLLLPTKRARSILEKIIYAARQRLVCKIAYRKVGQRRLVRRAIHPYSYDKERYLVYAAPANKKKEIRSFRLDRITAVKILRDKFNPNWEIEL